MITVVFIIAKQTGKDGSSDKTLMYVVIAAITSLICGIIFGACGHHKLHSRNCNYKEKNGNKVLDGRTGNLRQNPECLRFNSDFIFYLGLYVFSQLLNSYVS